VLNERLAMDASGYGLAMARARTPTDPNDDRLAAAGAPAADDGYDAVGEQERARRARAERDQRLSTAERLERLHRLCAQLATMTAARPHARR
jgi:hypothetical protein